MVECQAIRVHSSLHLDRRFFKARQTGHFTERKIIKAYADLSAPTDKNGPMFRALDDIHDTHQQAIILSKTLKVD